MANESRKWTRLLLEAVENGYIHPNEVLQMCLNHMSEFDVADMCMCNDLESLDPDYKEEDE